MFIYRLYNNILYFKPLIKGTKSIRQLKPMQTKYEQIGQVQEGLSDQVFAFISKLLIDNYCKEIFQIINRKISFGMSAF